MSLRGGAKFEWETLKETTETKQSVIQGMMRNGLAYNQTEPDNNTAAESKGNALKSQ